MIPSLVRATALSGILALSLSAVPAAAANAHLPTHVVVIVQENRSVDNLFQGFPGADTQSFGFNSRGQRVNLQPEPLEAPFDPEHDHNNFVTEFENGSNNGWDLAKFKCNHSTNCPGATALAYVPQTEVQQYFALAENFAFADHVYQSNEGPSFPAHQYLIAAQSGSPLAMSENPHPHTGGCNRPGARVHLIDLRQKYPGQEKSFGTPCVDYLTIFDEVDEAPQHLTWRYYTPSYQSIWTAPFAVKHLYQNDAADVITPETTVLKDIADHHLANLTFVIPRRSNSDHAGFPKQHGPEWVADVANAIGNDPYYWDNTTILVVWDDWGGWFDHDAPFHPGFDPTNDYEFGYRVPLVAISPYVVGRHYVSHVNRDFTSVLTFIENVFGLPSLNQLDAKTDDLSDMFDFTSRQPLPYIPAKSNISAKYFESLMPDATPVDGDDGGD